MMVRFLAIAIMLYLANEAVVLCTDMGNGKLAGGELEAR